MATSPMTTPLVRPDVADYVAQVRARLDDLTADEVDELTEGLDADLSDALQSDGPPETGTVTAAERFGDPASYADELRAAAGLPPRVAGRGRRGAAAGWLVSVSAQARQTLDAVAAPVRRQRWWRPTAERLALLRPVWWVLRGWVAYQFLDVVLTDAAGDWLPGRLGNQAVRWVALAGCVLVSLELGRLRPAGRLRGLSPVWTLAAVLAVPIAWSHGSEWQTVLQTPAEPSMPDLNGIWLDGSVVANVFPYDLDGRPLAGVQLFTDDGRRLSVGNISRNPTPGDGWELDPVPAVNGAGQPVWNVFPLRQQQFIRRPDATGGSVTTPDGAPRVPLMARPSVPAATEPTALPTPQPS